MLQILTAGSAILAEVSHGFTQLFW